jgi:hypothetical protein
VFVKETVSCRKTLQYLRPPLQYWATVRRECLQSEQTVRGLLVAYSPHFRQVRGVAFHSAAWSTIFVNAVPVSRR